MNNFKKKKKIVKNSRSNETIYNYLDILKYLKMRPNRSQKIKNFCEKSNWDSNHFLVKIFGEELRAGHPN